MTAGSGGEWRAGAGEFAGGGLAERPAGVDGRLGWMGGRAGGRLGRRWRRVTGEAAKPGGGRRGRDKKKPGLEKPGGC